MRQRTAKNVAGQDAKPTQARSSSIGRAARRQGVAASLLGLQRTQGNRYVQRLLSGAGVEHQSERINSSRPEEANGNSQANPTGITSASGHPLDPATRSLMESRFGRDLSRVRVHHDESASVKSESLNADAFTTGRDIFFGERKYSPHTDDGRATLAHELAHTVQNEHRGSGAPAREQDLEAEASIASLQIASGQPAKVELASHSPVLKLTRGERASRGTAIGALVGVAVGGAALGIAAAFGASLGGGAIAGALVGGLAAGAAIGALAGYFARRTRPVRPEEADRLIRGQYGSNLTAAIAAGTQAETVFRVVDDAQFQVAYQAYFGSIDADYPHTNAFVDRSTTPPTVWVHQDRQNPTTVLHEAIHIYSNRTLLTTYGREINEGVTEYFTRQIVERERLAPRDNYESQFREVEALVGVVGEDTLRHAYFEGDIAGLQTAVDNARGAGTFANWVGRMQASDWDGARAAIAAHP